MNRLLSAFFIPILYTRLRNILIVLSIFYVLFLFENTSLIQFFILSVPFFFFITDIMSFYYSKNISWMKNSYFNKSDLIKFFLVNQIGRYLLLIITNVIVYGFGTFFLYKMGTFNEILNIDPNKLTKLSSNMSQSIKPSHIPFNFSDIFRFYLSYGFALSVGVPAIFYLSPMGANHITPQEMSKNRKSSKKVKNILFSIYALIFLFVISFRHINQNIYPLTDAFNILWPFLACFFIPAFFVDAFNRKFQLTSFIKSMGIACCLAFIFSLPHILNIGIGLGRFNNPNSTMITKIEEAQFLGFLAPPPPKSFIQTALKNQKLRKSELRFIHQHAVVTHKMKFNEIISHIDNIRLLARFGSLNSNRSNSKKMISIYEKMKSINPDSNITKEFYKKFASRLKKRKVASLKK